jgi:hypothetical protein
VVAVAAGVGVGDDAVGRPLGRLHHFDWHNECLWSNTHDTFTVLRSGDDSCNVCSVTINITRIFSKIRSYIFCEVPAVTISSKFITVIINFWIFSALLFIPPKIIFDIRMSKINPRIKNRYDGTN